MALKVELKPHERIILGSCVITNTDQRATILIEGERLPILREKDVLMPETADTPAKLLYLAVQLMYISKTPQDYHPFYFDVLKELLKVLPTSANIIDEINNQILSGEYYKALKEAKKLIGHEEKQIENAKPELVA